jgi:hypothetical protein
MVFIPTDTGEWVSEEYERLARIIKDYDDMLELRWIPPQNRTREDKKPYVIVDTRSEHPVLYASELDTPTDILVNLIASDNAVGDVVDRLQVTETVIELQKRKQFLDTLEEAREETNFFINSPLHYVKHNGIKYDENRRRMDAR